MADEAATEAFLDHFREDLRQAVSKVLQDAESPPLVTLRTAINAVAGVVSGFGPREGRTRRRSVGGTADPILRPRCAHGPSLPRV